jgi:hypothetical protein
VQTIVNMRLELVFRGLIVFLIIFVTSCSKQREVKDHSFNENFKFELIKSTGTSAFFSIEINDYRFNNASDSVEYGLLCSYIDEFGYNLNYTIKYGAFNNVLNLKDTLVLDFGFFEGKQGAEFNVQFYCVNNNIYDKSSKLSCVPNSFFKVLNGSLGPLPITYPTYSTWHNSSLANEGRNSSFYEYPYLHFYSPDWQSQGHYTFNVINATLSSPNSLYANYYNSSLYGNSTRLFKVGSKFIIRRDSIYSANTLRMGKFAVLDFVNNRYDMTGPNFPTSSFSNNLPATSPYWDTKKTLKSHFWFDFGTYAYVLLGGYNSNAINAPVIVKLLKFNGVTEQFENEELLPLEIQNDIENGNFYNLDFITFNNYGYLLYSNGLTIKLYKFDPNGTNKWLNFESNISQNEGYFTFIPHNNELYILSQADLTTHYPTYVYKINLYDLTFKRYNNNFTNLFNFIPFPFSENGVAKSIIYSTSSFNGSSLEFNP